MDTAETWKPIENYPGYWVSESGRVWAEERIWFAGAGGKTKRVTPAHELNWFYKGKTRYHRVMLGYHLGQPKFTVHRLVAQHFLKKPDDYKSMHVHHVDGNPENNHHTNLRWETMREHQAEHRESFSKRFKAAQLGSGNTMAKHSEEKVLSINRLLNQGERTSIIATKMGVSQQMVSNIKSGYVWGHLTGRGE